MPFKKGKEKTGGKQKGTQNKLTTSVKDAFQLAFQDMQNDKNVNLLSWAKLNPTEFYRIASKLIPTDIRGDIKVIQEQPLFPE